ncbi:1-phosphofructokinase family hexose kinase [Neobacillus cucumis]|uniref:1-phosphofructokinase family hexose kinase n=1 Tax=Neobacillus cucumis TaxID=1740721 RepID=UPI002040CD7F|nr:1-phosphofructokinase family hexose kinase [Neobacillus cucumis]MCM3726588.1 1-phosphofructokinase family hexose kinase [Neobacillus cucumis]
MIYTVTLNTAIDRIVHIKGELTRKHNNKMNDISYDIGGKATHVSVVLSSLSINNIATGFVGASNKSVLINQLEKKDVTCEFIEQEGSSTRESLILIDESGKGSYMITDKGFTIKDESFEKLIYKLQTSVKKNDIVVFAGSPPAGIDVEKYKIILETVQTQKGKIIVDAAGDYLKAAVELKPTMIKPNEFEFQELVGKKLTTLDSYALEIQKLLNSGIEYVVISLGQKGSLVGHQKTIYRVTPPEVKEVNDTGCGDVFVGGVTAKLSQNSKLDEIFRFATALGASKATKQSSSDFSLEQAAELEKEVKIEIIGSDKYVVL